MLLSLLVVFILFVVYVIFFFVTVKENATYIDNVDLSIVFVVKRGLFKTTIAYIDKEPEQILTLEFMLRYSENYDLHI